jgi:hypothetical protein
MNKELVIAAYDRDCGWTQYVDKDVKVTIYNKNQNTLKEGEILLSPNVGRDVHTFFHHIVENYNNLSDYTFFVQDDPFDHVNNIIAHVNSNQNYWRKFAVKRLDGYWCFNTLYTKVMECDRYGKPQHTFEPDFDISPIWNSLFDEPEPEIYKFVAAGHFLITKEKIQTRPIDFYQKIKEILENQSDAPWIIERLENYIFDENFKIKI